MIKAINKALLLLLAGLVAGGMSGCGSNNNTSGTAPATEQIFYAQSVVFGNNSTLYGAGYNAYGQLGNGMVSTTQAYFTPVIASLKPAVPFGPVHGYAAGANHTLAFANNSTIYAWGSNFRGRLGVAIDSSGSKAYTPFPMLVRSLFPDGSIQPRMPNKVISVAAGWLHSLAVAGPNRSVYAWGAGNIGQLGNGLQTKLADSPFAIPVLGESGQPGSSLDRIKQVAAGGSHSLALNEDGVVFAWGDNAWGQVGDVRVSDQPNAALQSFVSVPVRVPGLPVGRVKKIAAAGSYSLALMEDGTVWGWGYNAFGQLGNGSASFSTPRPVEVITGKDSNGKDIPLQYVQDIQAGVLHALALVQPPGGSYQVWSWGANDKGQLGTGFKGSGNAATPNILAIFNAVNATVTKDLIANAPAMANISIYAFGNQSFIRIGGNLYGWGDNGSGELGFPVSNTSIGYLLQAVQIGLPPTP